MFKKILNANDGSDGSFKALACALDLARLTGAELHMVSVEELPQFPEIIEEVKAEKVAAELHARGIAKHAHAMAEERGATLQVHRLTGHAVRSIVDLAARLGADLLVIGATRHSTFVDRMIGTHARHIIEMAPCTVLIVK